MGTLKSWLWCGKIYGLPDLPTRNSCGVGQMQNSERPKSHSAEYFFVIGKALSTFPNPWNDRSSVFSRASRPLSEALARSRFLAETARGYGQLLFHSLLRAYRTMRGRKVGLSPSLKSCWASLDSSLLSIHAFLPCHRGM